MKPTSIRKSEDYTMVTQKYFATPSPLQKYLPPYPEIISNCTCFMSYQHIQYRQMCIHQIQ